MAKNTRPLRVALNQIQAAKPAMWRKITRHMVEQLDFELEERSVRSVIEHIQHIEQNQEVSLDKVGKLLVHIQGQAVEIYPVAQYGWDGGQPIATALFNVKPIKQSDILGGPYAMICRRVDPTLPGIVIHHGDGFSLIQVLA